MSEHISVLANEALTLLDVKEGGIYVDGTLGRGGHSKRILEKLGNGKLYVFDLDMTAIERSREILKEYENVVYIHDNFMNMDRYVKKADGILLDLGVSSPQFDQPERGFSYRFDGPLDMRMDKSQDLTASQIVNTWPVEEIEKIFREYGEEKFSYPIARNIVSCRETKPIETTFELVEIIKASLPNKVLAKKGHPAKQCFQSLRVAVNNELGSLSAFLDRFDGILSLDGNLAVITFHSLEDRLVKQRFRKLSSVDDDPRIARMPEDIPTPDYILLNRKPITASCEELENNPRAKSAKLRGIKKVKEHG